MREMCYGLGAGGFCWCPVEVETMNRITSIKGSDRKLVEIVDMEVVQLV